jgi:PAS domain S-box-containing protein
MYREMPEILEELRRCAREGVRLERTMPYDFKTIGERRTLSVRYVPVPPDLVMVHTEDITARVAAEEAVRRSEERLRSTLASMDDLVFVLDENLRFVSFHQPKKAEGLYRRPEEFLGKALEDVMPPHVARQGQRAAEAALASGKVQQFDYPLTLAGEERWFSAKVSSRLGGDGTPRGVTVVARDITKRRRAEQALAEAHATLEERVRERTRELEGLREKAEQLAAMRERERLARDLHDAVTQTLFSVSLIADALPALWERDPGAGQRQLVELGDLTRGALAEMRDLLVELRPRALEESSLGDLLRRLAKSIRGRTGLRVDLSIEEEGAVGLELKEPFYRIAQEALNNVAKHAAAGGAELRLRQRPGLVELRVRDDGRGFEREAVPSGTLGLVIMEERARIARARLSIESRPGAGTTVEALWKGEEEEKDKEKA